MWIDSWKVNRERNQPSRQELILPQAVEVTLTFENSDDSSRDLVISKVIPVMSDFLRKK